MKIVQFWCKASFINVIQHSTSVAESFGNTLNSYFRMSGSVSIDSELRGSNFTAQSTCYLVS